MKIDLDYLKAILIKSQNSERAFFTIKDIVEDQKELDTEFFFFHLQILADKEIIVNENDNSTDLGYKRSRSGQLHWSFRNLRLTANGHDLIGALENDTVWNKIKNEVKPSSISLVISTAKKLLEETIEAI